MRGSSCEECGAVELREGGLKGVSGGIWEKVGVAVKTAPD